MVNNKEAWGLTNEKGSATQCNRGGKNTEEEEKETKSKKSTISQYSSKTSEE